MNKYQTFGLISGQVLMGLLFGFVGVIVTALLWTAYEGIAGNYIGDLTTSILYSLYGGYVGMQIGIGFDGYKYLKEKGRLRDFKRFLAQSVVGLFLGLMTFYYLILSPGPKTIGIVITFLAFLLPLIGAIIGFDLGLIKKLTDTESKNW
jgi:hypothetical protein